MARQARIKSSTGIYHIMIKGINKEKIFIYEANKAKLLNIIKEIKNEIADLCNLSLNKVKELSKNCKNPKE